MSSRIKLKNFKPACEGFFSNWHRWWAERSYLVGLQDYHMLYWWLLSFLGTFLVELPWAQLQAHNLQVDDCEKFPLNKTRSTADSPPCTSHHSESSLYYSGAHYSGRGNNNIRPIQLCNLFLTVNFLSTVAHLKSSFFPLITLLGCNSLTA